MCAPHLLVTLAVLAVAVACCSCGVSGAATVTINTMSDFWALRDSIADGSSFAINIDVHCDLDLRNDTRPFNTPLGMRRGATTAGVSGCTAFSGVLDGHGHTVSHMHMDVSAGGVASVGGLLCVMDGATVRDLRIDGTCGVRGGTVGVLAGDVRGRVVVERVSSAATVSGEACVGGLIGGMFAGGVSLMIDQCDNDGTVTGSSSSPAYVGGLIGVGSINTTINNSNNHGTVTGSSSMSAFVGGLVGVGTINTTINNSNNHGTVTGSSSSSSNVGGLVGSGSTNTTIINSTNNAVVNASSTSSSSNAFAGGIIGRVNSNANTHNCSNNGAVIANAPTSSTKARASASGIIGFVQFTGSSTPTSINITSCSNNAPVTSSHAAAGLTLADNNIIIDSNTRVSVHNSINRGTVSAPEPHNQFALGTNIGSMHNTVSAGTLVSGDAASWVLCGQCTMVDNNTNNSGVFSLDVAVDNATVFSQHDATDGDGQFHAMVSGTQQPQAQRMDMLLNNNVDSGRQGGTTMMMWTSALRLVHVLRVVTIVGLPSPLDTALSLFAGDGDALNSVPLPPLVANNNNQTHMMMDSHTGRVFELSDVVTRDITLCIDCHRVVFVFDGGDDGEAHNATVAVPHNHTLGSVGTHMPAVFAACGASRGRCVIVDATNHRVVVTNDTRITRDVTLVTLALTHIVIEFDDGHAGVDASWLVDEIRRLVGDDVVITIVDAGDGDGRVVIGVGGGTKDGDGDARTLVEALNKGVIPNVKCAGIVGESSPSLAPSAAAQRCFSWLTVLLCVVMLAM